MGKSEEGVIAIVVLWTPLIRACSLFPAVFVNISMLLFLYNERVITVRPLVATHSQVYTLW
jgi:hypothetical protein